MDAARLRRTIFAACRELGLDDDARKALQEAATGKASLSGMGADELGRVIEALKARGWRPARTGRRRKAAARPDLRYAHVLWRMLHEAGEARVAGAEGLNAFVRARFGERWGSVPADFDMLRNADQIDDVIQALKAWCARAGIKGVEP
ncbi:MAG: regulatory protein GemA, partial [Pseudomonadota bacterium]